MAEFFGSFDAIFSNIQIEMDLKKRTGARSKAGAGHIFDA